MENKINGEKLRMGQIPAKLFNSQYLSDITFIIEDRPIYAHSLLLMVRSSVFEEQLEHNQGEKKLIPISDYGYDVFYQLIRFLYTDQVDIDDAKWFHLMKLAKKYNVIKLIDHLMNNTCSEQKIFRVCVFENYKIGLKTLNDVKFGQECRFDKILRSDDFLSIHPDVLEEILNFNQIKEGITESHIIDAMVRWMNHYCKQNQIQFSDCRQKFDRLIHLIRFPTLSTEELQNIKKQYPDLLTKSDFKDIASYKLYGDEDNEGIWNSIPRIVSVWPYELKAYPSNTRCEIKFSVSSIMILGGFVSGEKEVYDGSQLITKFDAKLASDPNGLSYIYLGLGASNVCHPRYIYTIFWSCANAIKYWSRKPLANLIVNAPPNSVKILNAHPTFLEILFLDTDGSTFD